MFRQRIPEGVYFQLIKPRQDAAPHGEPVVHKLPASCLLHESPVHLHGGAPVVRRDGHAPGLRELPTACGKTRLRRMDGLALALVLIVGHVEIHSLALRIGVIHHDVIAEFQLIEKLLLHVLTRALPLAYLHGELTEWFRNRHLLSELNTMRQSKRQ